MVGRTAPRFDEVGWRAVMIEAAEAELWRRVQSGEHRFKLRGSCAATAPFVADAVFTAWRCYRADAAAALFDVLGFFDTTGLPMPAEVACERDALLDAALRGGGAASGVRGKPSPLAGHEGALRKRLRWHAVSRNLEAGRRVRDADDPKIGAVAMGADPALYAADRATWPETTKQQMRAAEMAGDELGEPIKESARTIYDDAREVGAARMAPGWPGRFYLPTAATVERLGMDYAPRLLREFDTTDGPLWVMA